MTKTKNKIRYRDGYKYQLTQPYIMLLGITPDDIIDDDFIGLDKFGLLTIRAGYAWDGASSIALDTASFMRGSLVHDALYQLIADGKLPAITRVYADDLLRRLCREDGMSAIRAWYVHKAVRMFGGSHTKTKPEIIAP